MMMGSQVFYTSAGYNILRHLIMAFKLKYTLEQLLNLTAFDLTVFSYIWKDIRKTTIIS